MLNLRPITARSLQKPYHIKADEFERAYKDFLSGYRTWKELAHAEDWLVFHKNIGPYLSIDETALSDGELYTIISNKAVHGGKGAIVAIVIRMDAIGGDCLILVLFGFSLQKPGVADTFSALFTCL